VPVEASSYFEASTLVELWLRMCRNLVAMERTLAGPERLLAVNFMLAVGPPVMQVALQRISILVNEFGSHHRMLEGELVGLIADRGR
jgi:hypothetical protein